MLEDYRRRQVRLACLKRARHLSNFYPQATDTYELSLAAALADFVLVGDEDGEPGRLAALNYVSYPKPGTEPNLGLILAQAKAFATFLNTGGLLSFGGDFAKEPPPDAGDGLLLDIRNLSQADAGESGGGLGIESALDPVGGSADRGDEIGVVGHEESSVDAGGSATTVGEAGRIGNDPTVGGAA